jgi:rhodanese-related sulfurtransferase
MNIKQLLSEANSVVPALEPAQAREIIAADNALIVDVRDPGEVQKTGKVKGAVNVSRGMIEFKACPESPYHDERFRKDVPVFLYCASGGRSALAGKTLKDLGYQTVYNLGGFKGCIEAGYEVEPDC